MPNDVLTPVGPLLSADRIFVTAADKNKVSYQLEIFPDGNNAALHKNGFPQQYYFMPQRIYLAKKQDSPQDFDFGMTIFKGYLTSATSTGIAGSGVVDKGGGFCTFSTTFAIPPEVLQQAVNALKNQRFDQPVPARMQAFMPSFGASDPAPLLGIVPILSNSVSIQSVQFGPDGSPSTPFWVQAQSAQKGSIEATGISSFLVSCNELSAGVIAGSLKAGVSPFIINYALTEQFYLPACNITVTIDMNKVYDSFSAAANVSGFFTSASFQYAYSTCVTSGAITTVIQMGDGSEVPADLHTLIMQKSADMQTNAINWVKDAIFNWTPASGADAVAQPTPFGRVFGGASVSMKSDYQRRTMNVTQQLTLETSVAVSDTLSGDLSDLEPAIKADLGKYLAEIDIGQYFQKIQVVATQAITWNEILGDGTKLSDPILSAAVAVSYPNFTQPTSNSNTPNLTTQVEAALFQPGQPMGQVVLAQWNPSTPSGVFNFAFLRLDNDLPQWPADQVKVTTTLEFDGLDPRVDFANGQSSIVIVTTDNNLGPVVKPASIAGYTFVRFAMLKPLEDNVYIVLMTKIGARTDTFTITSQNQKSVIWELFSDRYLQEPSFQYTVQMTVEGPKATDDPIVFQSAEPITVMFDNSETRARYHPLLFVERPHVPDELAAKVNSYLSDYRQAQKDGAVY